MATVCHTLDDMDGAPRINARLDNVDEGGVDIWNVPPGEFT